MRIFHVIRHMLFGAPFLCSSPLHASAFEELLYPPHELIYPYPAPTLTPDHIALIRKIRLSWNGVESGAPQCAPIHSFVGGTASELIRAELGDVDDQVIVEFMLSFVSAIESFTASATLTPGQYLISNMTRDLLNESKAGLDNPDELFAIGPDMTIDVTQEDITLLKSASWEWPYEDDMADALDKGDIAGPTVDPKRPYGDMGYYAIDIHRILEWPVTSKDEEGYVQLSEEQDNEAARLHFRQLGVMQAFFEHAEITLP